MGYSPDSPIDINDDLPRADKYGTWAARFSTANPPDGLSEPGSWGHVARWLAQKGGADITLRAVGIQVPNLLTQALLVEPTKRLGWPPGWAGQTNELGDNSRGGQRTLRGMLLWGINRTPDKIAESWTSNPTQFVQALAQAIERDPDPLVRLEALKLISVASFPVNRWTAALLPAIDRAQAILAETSYDATTRRALQKWLADAKSRLLTLLATQAGFPSLPGGDHLAPARSLHNWPLIIGGSIAGLGAIAVGVFTYRRRRSRSRRLPA